MAGQIFSNIIYTHIATGEVRSSKTFSGGTEHRTTCGAWRRNENIIALQSKVIEVNDKGQAIGNGFKVRVTCPECQKRMRALLQ